MRKIAVIYQYAPIFSKGGGEKRLFEIFSRLDIEVDWYVQFMEEKEIVRGNIRFIRIDEKKYPKRSIRETIRWVWKIKNVSLNGYSIVILGQMPFFHLPFLIKRLEKNKILFVVEFWEYWGDYWNKFKFPISKAGKWVENFILKRSKNIVVISNRVLDIISTKFPNKNLSLIPNGVNFSFIQKLSTKRNFDFVYFGRIEKHKGVDKTLLVFKALSEFNPNYKLAIIGTGSFLPTLKKISYELGISRNVHFLGAIKDEEMYSIVKGAKFFLFFSEQEGGSAITVLESNACGTPVVHSYSPNGIEESLLSHNNGIFFRNFNPEYIASKLYYIISNKEKYQKMRRDSIVFASKYDWGVIANQYKEFLRNLQ